MDEKHRRRRRIERYPVITVFKLTADQFDDLYSSRLHKTDDDRLLWSGQTNRFLATGFCFEVSPFVYAHIQVLSETKLYRRLARTLADFGFVRQAF